MSDKSSIEWTATVNPDGSVTPGATWNPVRGCTKVSPGCANCYAETFAERWRGVPGHPYEQGFDLRLVPEKLIEPLKWKEPRRVFVNSMSDLFQDGVPDQFIVDVFGVMALAYWHTFQVLTKRPDRMLKFLAAGDHGIRRQFAQLQINGGTATRDVFRALDKRRRDTENEWPWPLPNVWLGVSVENQHWADERIPLLLQTPAAVRFISAEPLLGPIYLGDITVTSEKARSGWPIYDALRGNDGSGNQGPRLDWVIVGGESGHGARPFDLAWARSIVEQCKAASVPVFVKQLGSKPILDCPPGEESKGQFREDGSARYWTIGFIKNRKGGDMSEWPEDLRIREFPAVRA